MQRDYLPKMKKKRLSKWQHCAADEPSFFHEYRPSTFKSLIYSKIYSQGHGYCWTEWAWDKRKKRYEAICKKHGQRAILGC